MEYTKERLQDIAAVMENENVTAAIYAAKDKEEVKKIFSDNGIEIDDEAAQATVDKLIDFRETGELSESDLELVAGGKVDWEGVLCTGIVVCGAIVGAGLGGPAGAVVGGAIAAGAIYGIAASDEKKSRKKKKKK